VCVPIERVVFSVAFPVPSKGTVPSEVPASKNVMVPAGINPGACTSAVNVTRCPATMGREPPLSVVLVVAGTPMICCVSGADVWGELIRAEEVRSLINGGQNVRAGAERVGRDLGVLPLVDDACAEARRAVEKLDDCPSAPRPRQ